MQSLPQLHCGPRKWIKVHFRAIKALTNIVRFKFSDIYDSMNEDNISGLLHLTYCSIYQIY